MSFLTLRIVLINHYSESPDSCGHFEPKISPIGQRLGNFSSLEVLKFGARKLELTGSTHLLHMIAMRIVLKERGALIV